MAKRKIKKYPTGGQVPPPTYNDSLALFNNAVKVLNYYNTPKYRREVTMLGPVDKDLNDSITRDNKQAASMFLAENSILVPGNSGKTLEVSPRSVEYRKQIDDYKYLQREQANAILDTRSPMQLFDTRIAPQSITSAENIKRGDPLEGDNVVMYSYAPLAVSPWNRLTDYQKRLRLEQFGTSGSPYKTYEEIPAAIRPTKGEVYNSRQIGRQPAQGSQRTVAQPTSKPKPTVQPKSTPAQPAAPQPRMAKPGFGYDVPPVFDIMTPAGVRVPREQFIKEYGQAAWDRATNQGKYAKNPQPTFKGNPPLYPKFGKGGPVVWNQTLADKDTAFQNWYLKNTLEGQGGIPYSEKLAYDYYSFYKNRGVGDIKNHFPDTYKRPNHETFSNESVYSTPENPGGNWLGEIYGRVDNSKNFVTERSTTSTPLSHPTINNYTELVHNPLRDNSMYTLAQILDPTGVTNYPDLYKSLQTGEGIPINVLGSLPIVGKYAKWLSGFKGARSGLPIPEITIKAAAVSQDMKKQKHGGMMGTPAYVEKGEGLYKMAPGGKITKVREFETQKPHMDEPGKDHPENLIIVPQNQNDYFVTSKTHNKAIEMGYTTPNRIARYYRDRGPVEGKAKKGGFFDKGIGAVLRNTGVMVADNALSVVGASNVANNNGWYAENGGGVADAIVDASEITNQVSKVAGQVAAGAVGGPGAMVAMGALQQGVASVDTPSQKTLENTNPTTAQVGNTVGQLGGMATQFMGGNTGMQFGATLKNGGMIRKYNPGGGLTMGPQYTFGQQFLDTRPDWVTGSYVNSQLPLMENPAVANASLDFDYNIGNPFYKPKNVMRNPDGSVNLENPAFAPNASTPGSYTSTPGTKKPFRFDPALGTSGIGFLSQSLGPMYDMIFTRGGKKYDRVKYPTVNPELADPSQALSNARLQGNATMDKMRRLGGSGRSQYMGALASGYQTSRDINTIQSQYDLQNIGIKNQFKQYNNQIGIQGMIDEAQNKARSEDINRMAVNQLGKNFAGATDNYITYKRYAPLYDAMTKYYSNYLPR